MKLNKEENMEDYELKKGIQACEEVQKEILEKIDLYLLVTKGNIECQTAFKELKQQLTNQSQQNKPEELHTANAVDEGSERSADTQTHTDTDKSIILDDNPFSIACYMQEHPEFVKELDTCKKAVKNE